MNRIIRKSDQTVMPWKNGQGSTAQIDISPKGSSFPDGDFSWRLSSATVGASGPFSQFPGCDRLLVVLSGQGLLLNGKTMGPYTPVHFQGEEVIHAELIQDAVVDLGLIYRRDKVQAQMRVVQFAANKSELLKLGEGFGYIYCASGEVNCEGDGLATGECIFTQKSEIKITTHDSNALLVLITIQPL